MKDVLFGILNWDRDPEKVRKSLRSLPGPERNLLVCTNQVKEWEEIGFTGKLIEADTSVAKSKNKIIDELSPAQEFCFVIEDDLIVKNSSIFAKYRKMMNDFSLDFTCYGYHNHTNRVLDQKPNPCVVVNDGVGAEHFFHRHPCSALMIFRNLRDPEQQPKFDERLQALETEFLITDLVTNKRIPFNGFLLDVPQSWKNFDRLNVENIRVKQQKQIQSDIEIRQSKIQLDNSADKVMSYIWEKTTK
jgi:hypothetical protein